MGVEVERVVGLVDRQRLVAIPLNELQNEANLQRRAELFRRWADLPPGDTLQDPLEVVQYFLIEG